MQQPVGSHVSGSAKTKQKRFPVFFRKNSKRRFANGKLVRAYDRPFEADAPTTRAVRGRRLGTQHVR